MMDCELCGDIPTEFYDCDGILYCMPCYLDKKNDKHFDEHHPTGKEKRKYHKHVYAEMKKFGIAPYTQTITAFNW